MSLKVFISWSGPQARAIASLLREWLPDVVQRLEPWTSSQDIEKGQRWSAEVSESLESTGQGIIVVTPDNLKAPWLNFEAGALAKSLDTARVRPFLVGLSASQLKGPLAEFQATDGRERDDVYAMVESLNEACEPSLDVQALHRSFDRTWEDFLTKLQSADSKAPGRKQQVERTTEDLLAEVLQRVRGIERELQERRDEEWHWGREDATAATRRRRQLEAERRLSGERPLPLPETLFPEGYEPEGTQVLHREFGPGVIQGLKTADGESYALIEFRRDGSARPIALDDPLLIFRPRSPS